MRHRRSVVDSAPHEIRARRFSHSNYDDVFAAYNFAGRHLAKPFGFVFDGTIHFQKHRAGRLRFYDLQRLSSARLEIFISSFCVFFQTLPLYE